MPQGSFPLVSCHKSVATRQLSTCQLSQICCHKAAFHLSVAKNVLPQGSFPLGSCPNSGTKSQFPHTYTSTNQLPHICSHKAAFPFVSCPNSDTKKQFPHTYRYVHILPQISCHISVATRQLFINLYFNKSMTSYSYIFQKPYIHYCCHIPVATCINEPTSTILVPQAVWYLTSTTSVHTSTILL